MTDIPRTPVLRSTGSIRGIGYAYSLEAIRITFYSVLVAAIKKNTTVNYIGVFNCKIVFDVECFSCRVTNSHMVTDIPRTPVLRSTGSISGIGYAYSLEAIRITL
ncbi:27421_t:CDS:2 [Dentiscutata erythropus]|uniref:27421_t:CDS:1 n=1 Tax=Dentiscutata erythropus TaxID=1348616 RepID=A0A9N9FN68_9GLOM|nr:27421_t:CDS:2 [Dentiscutata erythropus]